MCLSFFLLSAAGRKRQLFPLSLPANFITTLDISARRRHRRPKPSRTTRWFSKRKISPLAIRSFDFIRGRRFFLFRLAHFSVECRNSKLINDSICNDCSAAGVPASARVIEFGPQKGRNCLARSLPEREQIVYGRFSSRTLALLVVAGQRLSQMEAFPLQARLSIKCALIIDKTRVALLF